MKNKQSKRLNPHKVLKRFVSQRAMAGVLEVTQQSVSKMLRRWDEKKIPLPEKHHVRLARHDPAEWGHLTQ